MSTKITKQTIVNLKEFRENMEVYIDRIQKGESLTVFRRTTPIFKVSPIDEWGDSGVWETVVDFTKINTSGVPAREVLQALKNLK